MVLGKVLPDIRTYGESLSVGVRTVVRLIFKAFHQILA